MCIGTEYYKKARLESLNGCIEAAFDDYVQAFLSRIRKDDIDLEFLQFYRYQLARYLKGKKEFIISLPEGDMITELIYDSYSDYAEKLEESPFNVRLEDRCHLLESVRIIFPWQNDSLLLDQSEAVSN